MGLQHFKALKPEVVECHYCGRTLHGKEATIDHIVPRIKGGSNEHDNLVWACQLCNTCKSDSDYERFVYKTKIIPISKEIRLDDPVACKKYQGWWTRSVRKMEKLAVGYEPVPKANQ